MYLFNRFSEENLPAIGELCERYGLKEDENACSTKSWKGDYKESLLCLVQYSPNDKENPFVVQPWEKDYTDSEVRSFLREVKQITDSDRVLEGFCLDEQKDVTSLLD